VGFLKGFWLGVRTLIAHPIQYLTNPVEATSSMYREDLLQNGVTMAEVDQAITVFEDSGGILTDVGKGYGAATKALGNAVKSVGNILAFAGKNFGVILIVVIMIVVAWYFLMFRKVVA
jgi:hypothetical protein